MEFEAWWTSDKDFYSVSQWEGVGVGGGGEEIPQSLLIGVEPMAFWLLAYIRGTQQRFPPYLYFENTFWVLQSSFRSLEIKYLLGGAIEFVSVRSS